MASLFIARNKYPCARMTHMRGPWDRLGLCERDADMWVMRIPKRDRGMRNSRLSPHFSLSPSLYLPFSIFATWCYEALVFIRPFIPLESDYKMPPRWDTRYGSDGWSVRCRNWGWPKRDLMGSQLCKIHNGHQDLSCSSLRYGLERQEDYVIKQVNIW